MAQTKQCENCGKTFVPEQPHHRYCSPRCYREAQAQREGGGRRPARAWSGTRTTFRFDENYLRDGYFDKGTLRPELVDEVAIEAAKVLGNSGLTSHQLRRFFNKMRGIEAKLDTHDFAEVRNDIYGFKRDVAYAVGRGVVSEDFKRFIDRNVELATQSEKDFRQGFIEHFQSVLAYFVYYFRDR